MAGRSGVGRSEGDLQQSQQQSHRAHVSAQFAIFRDRIPRVSAFFRGGRLRAGLSTNVCVLIFFLLLTRRNPFQCPVVRRYRRGNQLGHFVQRVPAQCGVRQRRRVVAGSLGDR